MGMTEKQTRMYWRAWAAVRRADPEADRQALTVQALGRLRSSKDLTNAELDRVLAAFRAVSHPDDVDGQLRPQEQAQARRDHRIAEVMACLRVYRENPEAYVARVIADRQGLAVEAAPALADLDDRPTVRTRRDGVAYEGPSELDQVLMTVWSRIHGLRRKAGHTLHAMRMAAGWWCDCARICRAKAPADVEQPF
jgi:hypothetical protein